MAENLSSDSNNIRPSVSVVMTVFNAEEFLKEAIQSILDQTFSDFELICVDDGSTDRSGEILKSFADPRIRILKNDKNKGIVYSANRAIREARANLIARFDSDDLSLPQRLARQVEFMQSHPEIAVCTSRIQLIGHYGNALGYWPEDVATDTPEKIKKMLPVSNCVAQPAVMGRSEIFRKFGYREEMKISEDWALWLEIIAEGYSIGKINEPLVQYRVHPSSFTQKANSHGVYAKLIRFKRNFLRSRIKRNKFSRTDALVFLSLVKQILFYPAQAIVHPLLSKIKLAIKRKPWKFPGMYFQIPSILQNRKVIFFFPYYHTGGAENVHLSIAETVKDFRTAVLITGKSNDKKYLSHFNNVSVLIDISDFSDFPFLATLLLKRIASCINKSNDSTVFGSNSLLFYKVLPLLNAGIKKVDLIHAFVHEHEAGPEKWSLPFLNFLDQRVFISKHAMQQMRLFYMKNNVGSSFEERMIYIRNFTPVPENIPDKESAFPLNILYIGRSGNEKRISLILEAARHFKNDPQVQFILIGDVQHLIPKDLIQSVSAPGMISSESVDTYLKKGHVLVLTSSREGMPMVIFEAMAHGVIPVSTDVGDISEYVKNNETGYLLPVKPDQEIVNSLIDRIEFLKLNPAVRNNLSSNCYRVALQLFSRDNFVQSYRTLLLKHSSK